MIKKEPKKKSIVATEAASPTIPIHKFHVLPQLEQEIITTLGNEQTSSFEDSVKPIQVISLGNLKEREAKKELSPGKISFTPIKEVEREESPDLTQRARPTKIYMSR